MAAQPRLLAVLRLLLAGSAAAASASSEGGAGEAGEHAPHGDVGGDASPPHLLLVVVDDLGIDDTSVRVPGSTPAAPNGVLSPHIESLAASGIVLTDWHVFKFCSPSRSQMLTGRYAYHLGQQTQMNLNPDGARCGIHTGYSMLPKLLKQRGYRSYMLGKWHQGFFRREYIPTERGFDRFIGFYTGGESHRTHVTSYGVYGYLPSEWTPAINETIPSKGCSALWDMHNDTAGSAPSAPAHFGGFAAEANGTYSNELCKCAKTLCLIGFLSKV